MTAQSAEPEIYPGKLELRAPLAASASGPLFKRPNAGADRSAVRRHPRRTSHLHRGGYFSRDNRLLPLWDQTRAGTRGGFIATRATRGRTPAGAPLQIGSRRGKG